MSVSRHILVLTPDQRRRERQRRALEKAGHTTAPASVLQDALARVGERQPDVVMADLWIEDSPFSLVMVALRKIVPDAQFIAFQLDATQDQYARDALHAGAFATLEVNCQDHLVQACIERAAERKQLQRDLADVQERLALLFSKVNAGILVVDDATRQVVDANPAAVTLCGRTREDLVTLKANGPHSGLPDLYTLATLNMGGRVLLLQGISGDVGTAQHEELQAIASAIQDVAFEGGSDACLTVQSDGAIAAVVHGGVLTGVRMQVGRVAAEIFDPQAGADFTSALRHVYESGEEQHLSMQGATGPSMTLRLLPVKLRDVTRLVVVHCRHVDADVRENMRLRLRDVATDEAGLGFLVMSRNGRVVDANRQIAERLDLASHELIDMHYWDIERDVQADAWPAEWDRIDAEQRVVRDGTYLDRLERSLAMRIDFRLIEIENESFVVAISQDVSNIRAVDDVVDDYKRHDQVVLDLIQDGVIAIDRQGTVLEANQAACRWLRREPGRVVDHNYYDLLPESISQARKTRVDEVFIRGERISFEDADEEHSYENHLLPVRNHAGVLSELILLSRRIWQPTDATLLSTRQDADYSLEADQRARIASAALVEDRITETLTRTVHTSAHLSALALAGNEIEPQELDTLAQTLNDARHTLEATLDELRTGGPPKPGLMASLSLLAGECRDRWGAECACNISAVGLELSLEQTRHLCAIARDAVEYAVSRRNADVLKIAVKSSSDGLHLRISDNATSEYSFADSGAVMAIINRRVHELGGTVSLDATPGGGETLTCVLSLDKA